jgi:hypothetical protein
MKMLSPTRNASYRLRNLPAKTSCRCVIFLNKIDGFSGKFVFWEGITSVTYQIRHFLLACEPANTRPLRAIRPSCKPTPPNPSIPSTSHHKHHGATTQSKGQEIILHQTTIYSIHHLLQEPSRPPKVLSPPLSQPRRPRRRLRNPRRQTQSVPPPLVRQGRQTRGVLLHPRPREEEVRPSELFEGGRAGRQVLESRC